MFERIRYVSSRCPEHGKEWTGRQIVNVHDHETCFVAVGTTQQLVAQYPQDLDLLISVEHPQLCN